ncbi:DUF3800 domain-containing protein [Pseudolysinimonas sp.]|jgi:hypothetical protein|uniref:DUF3800 domain-containing protein n=1 Tax=Pseudolysinimonas sp. TaxID=2680009 RepID=UPI0037837786
MQAYVDESIRGRDYILCGVIVPEQEVTRTRQSIKSQLRGRQTRLHMAKESAETKGRLIAHVADLSMISAVIVIRTSRESDRVSRDGCLAALTDHLVSQGLRRMVIESCDQDKQDRQIIGDVLARTKNLDRVNVVHHRPSDEPLLWLADIVAWAHGGSSAWRSKISSLSITELRL